MADVSSPAAIDRIERAITRIAAATSNRDLAHAALANRHVELRARMEAAIAALDTIIAQQDAE